MPKCSRFRHLSRVQDISGQVCVVGNPLQTWSCQLTRERSACIRKVLNLARVTVKKKTGGHLVKHATDLQPGRRTTIARSMQAVMRELLYLYPINYCPRRMPMPLHLVFGRD